MGCCQAQQTLISTKQNGLVSQLKLVYEINPKILGSGSFGKVFLGRHKKNPDHCVAIKVISKEKFADELDFIRQEVQILSSLDHPNITKYYETYEDSKYLYLVMEYCDGGELIDRISKKSTFSEKEAANIMDDLLKAINHCHNLKIAHRDIKPENIMYGDDGMIKLIDFGLAKQTKKFNNKMSTLAGTPYFISPEILKGVYSHQCDLWSFGILLYLILSGSYPFSGETRPEVFDRIQYDEPKFKGKSWSNISYEAKDLIVQMLEKNPKKRITAEKALEHPWIQMHRKKQSKSGRKIDPAVIAQLKEYKGQSKLKKAAMNMLVKMLNAKEINHLREEFAKIDTDHSGFIEFSELEKALKKSRVKMNQEEIDSIILELDADGNKMINYSEFLAATIQIKTILTHQRLEALFSQFDVEGKNQLTKENIVDVMKKFGKEISPEEIEEILKKHDTSNDGIIQFDEFKHMLLDEPEEEM